MPPFGNYFFGYIGENCAVPIEGIHFSPVIKNVLNNSREQEQEN